MIYIDYDSMDACFWFGLEKEIMESGEPDGEVFLFWRNNPTLMLGRYQNAAAEIDAEYTARRGIKIVRRQTGGGTIYTDPGSWQFSFIRPETSRQIDFTAFVEPLHAAFKKMGLDVEMTGRNDLLIGGRKFCGNAQFHSRGRVLHHGSILFDTDLDEMERCLRVDEEKIVTKGIRSVRQRVTNLKEHIPGDMDALGFKDALLRCILGSDFKIIALDPEKAEKIKREQAPMFESEEWVFGNSPNFQINTSKRLPGGKVEIRMNLVKNRITYCAITGDFFFAGDIAAITDKLKGCPYTRQSVQSALSEAFREQPFFGITLNELLDCIF